MTGTTRPRKTARRFPLLVLLAAGAVLCCLVTSVYCTRAPAVAHGPGLFSWHDTALEEEGRESLLDHMEALGLTELYQSIPRDAEPDVVRDFLSATEERGIAVYLLTGDPSWGLDASGRSMREAVRRAATLPGSVRGVMMDVEPYTTKAWKKDRDGVMADYVAAMRRARKAADDAGLELVACIPYFYDTEGQTQGLETLVAHGCHALAVMNYDKKDEASNLETEAALARRYGRPLTMIYELQAPGEHDLTENNTYHGDGLDALAESWEALRTAYPDLSYALHHYGALEEVLENE